MNILALILTIFALVCFTLAAFNVATPRTNLIALGLAFLTGAILLTGLPTID